MPEFDASNSDCFIYVFRKGVLSAMGHDLKLRATHYAIEIDETLSIQARFRADALRVVGALKNGVVDERALSLHDRQEIERNIVNDVLEARKYPTISFRSTPAEMAGDRHRVIGRLNLHGAARDVELTVEQSAGRAVARATVHQPAFGIKPYRAFLGALQVKPDVIVEVSLPFAAD